MFQTHPTEDGKEIALCSDANHSLKRRTGRAELQQQTDSGYPTVRSACPRAAVEGVGWRAGNIAMKPTGRKPAPCQVQPDARAQLLLLIDGGFPAR